VSDQEEVDLIASAFVTNEARHFEGFGGPAGRQQSAIAAAAAGISDLASKSIFHAEDSAIPA